MKKIKEETVHTVGCGHGCGSSAQNTVSKTIPPVISETKLPSDVPKSVSPFRISQNDRIREGKEENIIIRIPTDDDFEDSKPFGKKETKEEDEDNDSEFVLPDEKKDRQIDPGFGIGALPGPDEGDEDGGGLFGEGEDYCACICFCDDEDEAENEDDENGENEDEQGPKGKLENADNEDPDDEEEAEDVIILH